MSDELKQAMKALIDLFDDDPSTWVQARSRGYRHSDGSIENMSQAYSRYPDLKGPNCWCLSGGVLAVSGSGTLVRQLEDHIAEPLPKYSPLQTSAGCIIDWNDESERTFSDIKKLLVERYEALS